MRRIFIHAALAGVALSAGSVAAMPTSGEQGASRSRLADLEPAQSLSIASRVRMVAANGAGEVMALTVIRDAPAILGGPRLDVQLAPGEKAPTSGDYRGVIPITVNYN